MEELIKLNRLVEDCIAVVNKSEALRSHGDNTIHAVQEIHSVSEGGNSEYMFDDSFLNDRISVCDTLLQALDITTTAVINYKTELVKLSMRKQ